MSIKRHGTNQTPLLVGGIYVCLAIFITYPVAWQLGTAVPGSEGDVWVHLWTFNWVKQALLSGQSPFYTPLIFFPQGASLITHNFAWLHIALWLPLQAIVGLGAAYSLLFLTTFAFNGFATYLFALELRFSNWAAFVSGLIVAFYPYILSHHDHPNLIVVGWLPLALLFLQRTISQQRRRDALWAALCLALLGITRWQLLFFATPLIAIYLLYELAQLPAPQRRQPIRLLLLTAATILLLLIPILLIILRGAQISTSDLQVTDELFSQADLLGYFLPSRYNPWWGDAAFRTFYGNLHNSDVFIVFIGYTTLGLLLYGLRQRWPKTRLWLIIAFVYLLLALGPELLVNGRSLLPLPYALLKNTLIDIIVRRPARFNLFLALPIALLAGQGIERLWQQHRQSARLLSLGCIALILLEYQVHYPTLPLNSTPAWYSQLAQEPGSFGILELPMHNRVYDEDYLFYQFTHGKPLVGGHVSRPPTAVFSFIHSLPMLQNIPDNQEPPTNVANVGDQLRQLAAANVRYLILHKQQLGAENLQKWQAWLALTPVHEDDDLVVYQTAVRVGQDTPWQPTGINGLGVVTGGVAETAVSQNSTLNLQIRWGSQTPLTQNHDVCFLLLAASSTPSQRTCQPISTQWPTSQWSANQLLDTHYQLPLDPYLPSGSYRVAANVGDPTPIPLGTITLTSRPRTLASNPTASACASWANRIILRDFTISQTTDNLTLQLTWLAQSRMTASYKLFVHLINNQTGELVSQSDTIPNNWSYPTTWWEQNELINDTLTLPTANIPSGRYQLRLGWYDDTTLERLDITSLTCPANVDNQSLLLQTLSLP